MTLSELHGWYSETQFRQGLSSLSKKRYNYLYYIDENDNIVQVTEIKCSQSPSNFKDANYLGKMKKWYKSMNTELVT